MGGHFGGGKIDSNNSMDTSTHFDVLIVGGFGHVGLPLGIALADAGMQVALYDIDASKKETILAGTMPFMEDGAEPILKRVIGKSLHIVDDISAVSQSDTIIVTIGTPVDEYLGPKIQPLFRLFDSIADHLVQGQCIVLRSTVFPGTTDALHQRLHDQGKGVHLAYCPERIVQGKAIKELSQLPQIVSGCTDDAIARSGALFERLGVEVIPVETQEAEHAKLFLNAWRYIQFAVGNQFYMMAQERGLDYDRIYYAMTHHYDRGKSLPTPGFAAGPCLLKDTMQLAASSRYHFTIGNAAMTVNEGLPGFMINQLLQKGVSLEGKTVGILGMAFKKDIDDIRDSLSYKLRKMLAFHGSHVLCSDEYVKDDSFVSKEEVLEKCDVVFVAVPHTAYESLSWPANTVVMDLWGVTSQEKA